MPFSEGLSRLQLDLLRAFSCRRQDFFLTGGAALIGFHGIERRTEDLDLFTLEERPLDEAGRELELASREIGARCAVLRAGPDFRRYFVERESEATTVDLVRERVAQVIATKPRIEGISVDPPEEILANKLCTLVSRSEVRDFWDTYQLSRRGLSLEQALLHAQRKDAGVTAESLVWLLSEINWPALARLAEKERLAGWEEVERFFRKLQDDLGMGLLPQG